MPEKIELIREEKLHRLLPQLDDKQRLEASGVLLIDSKTAAIVFDNLHRIALVDLSLESVPTNRFELMPGLDEGFEGIAIDRASDRLFTVVESLIENDGIVRGFVMEGKLGARTTTWHRMPTVFESTSKGYEGILFEERNGVEHIHLLAEAPDADDGRGRLHTFARNEDGSFRRAGEVVLPRSARFDDFAGVAWEGGHMTVVSQASRRLWTAPVEHLPNGEIADEGTVYEFPEKTYGNVEGVAWVGPQTLVVVSDRAKKNQDEDDREKDQSIHIFRIPE